MLFSTINNISISVKRSNYIFVVFKDGWHANPRAERNFAGPFSYILKNIFLKFSKKSANNKVSR